MEFFKGVADFFVASFPFGLLNVFVLAFVIAIIVERFVFILMKYRVNSREFMAQIRKLVQAGNIDRAIKLCEAAPLPLLQVVKAGLSQVNRGEDAVISAMEERMAEVIPDLEKRIASLWSLANIATLIGLLGTISGLIRTFQSMDLADKAEQAQKLSEGLAEAMYNTALGLGIAVFCMFFHLILHGWAKRLKLDMERSVMKLENLIASRKQG
jgi:biopolymer transport protein ExbB/TolQ